MSMATFSDGVPTENFFLFGVQQTKGWEPLASRYKRQKDVAMGVLPLWKEAVSLIEFPCIGRMSLKWTVRSANADRGSCAQLPPS